MDSKLCFFLTAFITLVHAKSFTIIVDTTDSMQDEINVIRRNIGPVADFTKNVTDFENYIIVPFNDPDVGPPIISTNTADFVETLSSLTVSGGNDCPEDALAGIQKGLEVSQPESFIYVFTDAYAIDDGKFRNIESLCKSSRSQVVIFLSGFCSGAVSRQQGTVDIYYDIARACSGAFFRFDSVNLRKAFNYMKEMVAADWTDVINHEPFDGYKQFSFTVDKFTSDVLVAVSGDYAALQILDTEGTSPRIQKIVDTRQSLVVRVVNAKPGVYQTSVRCEGVTSLTFYKKKQVPFQFGFSTRRPSSLKETSVRPIPGWINYMLIVLPPTYNIQITSVILQMADGKEQETLDLMESKTRKGYYVASVASLYMEPGRTFRCVIQGRDTTTYEKITASTKIVAVQRQVQEAKWAKPVVEIIEFEENPIDFGKKVTIACRVNGYPKPEISWEDSVDSSEEILLEIPATYISYGTVNVTTNSTITCKATNSKGEDEQHLDLFVHRTLTFDVIEKPKDETFKYGYEGRLYCKVDAYPEAEVNWYHNDSSVSFNYNIEVISDENTLLIKNMTLDEVGTYKCEAKNSVKTESFEAVVSISGLDPPQIDVEKSEVILKPGDWTDIVCRVRKGNPTPEITWKYQSDNEFDTDSSLPSEVYADGGKLKIPAVKIEHKGTYKCLAKNIMGEDIRDVVVKIQYAPKITNTEEGTLEVTEGDLVELNCDVDAIPKAVVRWEVTQGDVLVTADERHSTNDRNTHRFHARDKDSGNYHCIAENDIGKTERTITVNVLVPPYIQPPQSKSVKVSTGQNVSLTCNVLVGNPVPYTKWEFIAYDSTTTVLSSGNTTVAELQLFNVTRNNEGMYLCIADNNVGNDRIRIHLKVL